MLHDLALLLNEHKLKCYTLSILGQFNLKKHSLFN